MRKQRPQESTGRVVALALAFFGSFALLGYANGVFEQLSPEVVTALAVFAAAYAAATCALDPSLRAWIAARVRRPRRAPAKSPARSPAAT
jgi:hypothetical protein